MPLLEGGCPTAPIPFLSPPSSSLSRSPLFSDHNSTAEGHASHFDHHTRGEERGREGGIAREKENPETEYHAEVYVADVEEVHLMEQRVSQLMES